MNSRRMMKQQSRKEAVLFQKKEPKNFYQSGLSLSGETAAKVQKFFFKKEVLTLLTYQ
jgi:hypothetical protein